MRRRVPWWNRLAALAAAGLLAATLGGCVTNPATGQSQFVVLSQQQEIALGEQAEPDFVQSYGGEIPHEELQRYVSGLGQRLAAESERADLPWEFHAVDSEVVNAFALPGGKIFLTRGLLTRFENEAQLAGVLGHEIGHVTAKHVNDQMVNRLAVSAVLVGLGIAAQTQDEDWLNVLGAGAQVGGALYLLSYGRGQEHQADELGLRYMTRLGYHPDALVQVMEMFERESQGARPPEWLSTHPLPSSRIAELRDIIAQRYPEASQQGRYRFGEADYRAQVLNVLDRLPPPKHTGERQGE